MAGIETVTVQPEEKADPSKVPAGATIDKNGTVQLSTETVPEKKEDTLIGGKFKTQDDLLKAYQELEKKQGSATTEKPAENAVEKPAEKSPTEIATKTIEDAGMDLDTLASEVFEKGELSEKSKMAMVAKGIKKETVDNYVAGQKAVAEKIIAEVHSVVGGGEQYGKLTKWADANLSDDEVGAFNEAIHSGNTHLAKLAVQGLASRYNDTEGSEGSFVTGSGAGNAAGIQPFASQHEIVRAMADPRYKSGDTAYIAEVTKRMQKTKVLG